MVLLAKFMPLPTFTEEELKAAERELRGKSPKKTVEYDESRPRPRSLHHIDDEDEDEPASPQRGKAPQNSKGSGKIASAPLKDDRKDDE